MTNEYDYLDSWDNPRRGLDFVDVIASWAMLIVVIVLFGV